MKLLVDYALQFVGKPYVYGDKNPALGGIDCSGYVCEILKFAGELPGDAILSAQMLYDHFDKKAVTANVRSIGTLAFFGKSVLKITHVGFMVDSYRMLHAAGGDSTTLTPEDADKRPRAIVRGDLVTYRPDLVATLKPRYAGIGVIS